MTNGTVLVGTVDGLWGGNAGTVRRVHFDGQAVRSLSRDGPGHLAITDQQGVWQSDGVNGWRAIGSAEPDSARCLCSTERGVFVGGSGPSLSLLRDGEMRPIRSFDTAPGRDEWYTPWGGPAEVRSMTADPAGTVYVNVHVGGIARTADGGESWEPTIHIHADVHQVLHHDRSNTLFAATGVWGMASSTNGGGSWQTHTEELHGTYLRGIAITGETVLVTASTGPSSRRSAVYRRPLTGGPFERCKHGLPEWFSDNIDTSCLTAHDAHAAFGTADGQVFLSNDEGRSWNNIASGLPRVLSVAITTNG